MSTARRVTLKLSPVQIEEVLHGLIARQIAEHQDPARSKTRAGRRASRRMLIDQLENVLAGLRWRL